MPRKRTIEETDDEVVTPRRYTRSTAAATTVDDDRGHRASPRKRRRGDTPESEPENSRKLCSPTPIRTYSRRTNASRQEQGKVVDEAALEELKLGTTPPRNTRSRFILDAVEILTTPKSHSDNHKHRELLNPDQNSHPPKTTQVSIEVPHISNSPIQETAQEKVKVSTFEGELPKALPLHFCECLERQKQAILNIFHDPPLLKDNNKSADLPANAVALRQLTDILGGSIERGEGNSCLLIGPSGSGKTKVRCVVFHLFTRFLQFRQTFESALNTYREDHRPIVIRLNGYVQHTDRLAIREIARQVVEQTGSKTFQSIDMEDDDNPFDDGDSGAFVSSLPPPSHLPSLIAALPTLPRPVVVLLDAFNIFTEQPRQALLYCLLDTVQSCRAGSSSQRGLAVVGLTSRIDVINFLEKRVKSRFSHRIFRTASPNRFEDCTTLLRECLLVRNEHSKAPGSSEWRLIWEHSVEEFLREQPTKEILRDMFGISRDIRRLLGMMVLAIAPA